MLQLSSKPLLNTFHVLWTKPTRNMNGGKFYIKDYILLCMILSALEWRSHTGPINLITDRLGYGLLKKWDLLWVWDDCIVTLDDILESIDPVLFWAAGKLAALSIIKCPCAIIDTDMIIWNNIENLLCRDIVATHSEKLDNGAYPPPSVFYMNASYSFPNNWDFMIDPINTSFLYLKNDKFRNYYIRSSFQFMNNINIKNISPIWTMCFAEQRILAMCAKYYNQSINYLLDLHNNQSQKILTHVWGFKRTIQKSMKMRIKFCDACIKQILKKFPKYANKIRQNTHIKNIISCIQYGTKQNMSI